MASQRRKWAIVGGGLAFLFLMGTLNAFLYSGSWPYLLSGFLSCLLILALLRFLPPLFRDTKKTSLSWKPLAKVASFFETAHNKRLFFRAGFAVILLVIFVIRFLSKHDYLESVSSLQSSLLAPYQVAIAALLNCWWVGALVYTLVLPFVDSPLFHAIAKWVVGPILVLTTLFLPLDLQGVVGALTDFSPTALLMVLEHGLMAAFCLDTWLDDPSLKLNASLRYGLGVAWVLLLLTSINDYLPKNLFGEAITNVPLALHFNVTHRIFLYVTFLLPIAYFFLLYPFDYVHRRAFLFVIAQCVLVSYASIKRIEVWQHFYSMPLHLCNTAMYIMPLTLAFRSYRLFYFTMFINVIGAFLALLMPNYSTDWPVMGTAVMEFYINHIYAASLPVLIIELGIFERPKWKYFGYSMVGFALYFVFVASLNIYYTGTATLYGIDPPDFFFINSDFIAEKVGQWGEDLWRMNVVWTQNGYTFTLHWPYLLSFFAVYVAFAFGMWYLYEMLFRSTDELILLHERRRAYKIRLLEFDQMQQRSPLMENTEKSHDPHLSIVHFSKRYGTAKTFAVEDFSLELEGGKIYGFLGKNGAGKSTIIKAIVGMHGFNEGTISVCGYDVLHEPVQAKEQIGFVPDNYALYENLTGRQYINYVADLYGVSELEREQRLSTLLPRLEMSEHFDQQMKTYSHGMKQKITIIAALVHEPKIWILDEPMTGVDPNSIFQIKECMREHARKGNIVFFSSHLIDVVENLCDEIIMIKHGRLVLTSSMADLSQNGVDLEALFLEKTADSEDEKLALLKDEQGKK